MPDAFRLPFLQSALRTAETRLKLAVARARWKDAIEYAQEAAALDDEIKALGAAEPAGAQNVVGRVRAQG
ncbi:MAG TPA: hypothetical protein VNF91_10760 [Candidatus Acidoferrum sp.]|nr:hypothetical protein [Candidatus Acidoferrum sp.]